MRSFTFLHKLALNEEMLVRYDSGDPRNMQQSLLNTARALKDKSKKFSTRATKEGIFIRRIA